ncbi:MAG: DUF3575 domain-containing protein [Gemmatimonadetes bacterium]|nr:DUF3575 domain-containing protein [Gemmatimonadota bacterium]
MQKVLSAFVVALVGATAPAYAQVSGPLPVPHNQTVSANPFGLVFGWFNAEYERKLTPATTWGVSGSMFDFDLFEYRNGNALLRYYPQGAALKGFFLGGRAGVYHVAHDDDDPDDDEATFFGAGFELGYTWLMGRDQRIGVSLGAGANRLFGSDLDGASLTIPTVRIVNVGISF